MAGTRKRRHDVGQRMIGEHGPGASDIQPFRGGSGGAEQDASPRLLVSVHMPKTAGTSFAAALQARFGAGYQPDYADLPMQAPRWRRQSDALLRSHDTCRALCAESVQCIHGHFLPAKYVPLAQWRQVGFVTWLRDPVERVVSHYHFWRRDYDGSDAAQPLRNRMLAEDWSLERFALGPELRNVYRQYLWQFDVSRFAFIGVTERYAQDLALFAERFLDGQAVLQTALANPDRGGEVYGIPARLRERIEAHHAADMALYRRARDRRIGASA